MSPEQSSRITLPDIDAHPLVVRLDGRANNWTRCAEAVRASGYHAEALLQEARAAAFRAAADDARELLGGGR